MPRRTHACLVPGAAHQEGGPRRPSGFRNARGAMDRSGLPTGRGYYHGVREHFHWPRERPGSADSARTPQTPVSRGARKAMAQTAAVIGTRPAPPEFPDRRRAWASASTRRTERTPRHSRQTPMPQCTAPRRRGTAALSPLCHSIGRRAPCRSLSRYPSERARTSRFLLAIRGAMPPSAR